MVSPPYKYSSILGDKIKSLVKTLLKLRTITNDTNTRINNNKMFRENFSVDSTRKSAKDRQFTRKNTQMVREVRNNAIMFGSLM